MREGFRDALAEYADYDAELHLRLSKSCETAPDDAIVHVGRVLEALLRDYWVRHPGISSSPSRTANLDVLISRSPITEYLEPIRVHAEVLQKMRNQAAHTGAPVPDEGDAADAVRRLLVILRWFRQERRSMAGVAGPGDVGHDEAPGSPGQQPQPAVDASPPLVSDLLEPARWEDGHPPLWEISAGGPWACVDIRGRPFLVRGEGASVQLTDSRVTAKLADGPQEEKITDLIATADGDALAIIAGETLAWADYNSGGRAPLRWVTARLPVRGARLLAGLRRKASVDLIVTDAGETFRLRVDSRGESARSVLHKGAVLSAAMVGTGLAVVGEKGDLDLVNGSAAILPDLPESGWKAIDAALMGREVGFVGLLDVDGAPCLYAACQGHRFQVRLSDAPVAARMCRSLSAGRPGVVIVEAGGILRAWRCDDLEPAHTAPGESPTGDAR